MGWEWYQLRQTAFDRCRSAIRWSNGQMRYWSNDARAVRGTGCAARVRSGGEAGIDTGRLSVRFDQQRMVIKSTMF